MGFSAGGNGSYSLQNHKHTNTALDGGALDADVTLVDAETLNQWWASQYASASQGKLKLLYEHLPSGTASSLNVPFTVFDDANYSKYVLEIFLIPTASFDLRMKVGEYATANVSTDGARLTNSGFVGLTSSAVDYVRLATTSVFQTNMIGRVTAELFWSDDATRHLSVLSMGRSSDVSGVEIVQGWINGTGTTTFDDITLETSTSTWKGFGYVRLYGVEN